MRNTIDVKEAAKLWGISGTRVSTLCKEGRVPGAKKTGKSWEIPADAQKPADLRTKANTQKKTVKQKHSDKKLPLPIGISDYRLASSDYYYIDKTRMIKDFLDEKPMVSLFTRPRRFGKTLNMDMLRTFFEKTEEDTSIYFINKEIWTYGQEYQAYQGKYPVIFVTFKDVKHETWDETFAKISYILSSEFSRHKELATSEKCTAADKTFYQKVIDMQATQTELTDSFLVLSKMLNEHHGIPPIIIIDEYDTPIQQGYNCNFYDTVILFMRNLFSGGLKDNKHLSYGFLTGILRVAKESIFSGLNNLKVNSVLDQKYSEYFGFTVDEVKEMASYYGASDKYDEIAEWYDGYQFGKTEIFNPWSVINYFNDSCEPKPHWIFTGSNDIIGEVLAYADEETYEKLHDLLQEKSFVTYIDTSVIYPQIRNNPSSIYSFLLVAGYLKMLNCSTAPSGDFLCEVALPNKEIASVYNKEILSKLQDIVPQSIATSIQEAIFTNNAEKLQKQLHKLLMESVSTFDTAKEIFYHGLVLGLCAMMSDRYHVTSNRESGKGRYDIQLMPKDINRPGVLIELKAEKDCSEEKLKALSQAALQQIHDKQYATEMTAKGVQQIFKFGVAFSGKNVQITAE